MKKAAIAIDSYKLATFKRVAEPFAWTDELEWHKPAHRAVMASVTLGSWMSAALDDPKVCDAMKADIREWFSAGEPMETLGQALEAERAAGEARVVEQCAEIAETLPIGGGTLSSWINTNESPMGATRRHIATAIRALAKQEPGS